MARNLLAFVEAHPRDTAIVLIDVQQAYTDANIESLLDKKLAEMSKVLAIAIRNGMKILVTEEHKGREGQLDAPDLTIASLKQMLSGQENVRVYAKMTNGLFQGEIKFAEVAEFFGDDVKHLVVMGGLWEVCVYMTVCGEGYDSLMKPTKASALNSKVKAPNYQIITSADVLLRGPNFAALAEQPAREVTWVYDKRPLVEWQDPILDKADAPYVRRLEKTPKYTKPY